MSDRDVAQLVNTFHGVRKVAREAENEDRGTDQEGANHADKGDPEPVEVGRYAFGERFGDAFPDSFEQVLEEGIVQKGRDAAEDTNDRSD